MEMPWGDESQSIAQFGNFHLFVDKVSGIPLYTTAPFFQLAYIHEGKVWQCQFLAR